MENPIKMDDLGGKPTIFGNPHIVLILPKNWGFQEAILSNSPKVHHRRLRAVVIKVSSGHRCNLDENAWGKMAGKLYGSEDG